MMATVIAAMHRLAAGSTRCDRRLRVSLLLSAAWIGGWLALRLT